MSPRVMLSYVHNQIRFISMIIDLLYNATRLADPQIAWNVPYSMKHSLTLFPKKEPKSLQKYPY